MSEPLRDRLRRLRREEQAARGAARLRDELPAWLRARLGRGADRPGPATHRSRTTGAPRDLTQLEGPRGSYAARDTLLCVEALHGSFALEEARAILPGALHLLTRSTLPERLDVERAVFLDIETTGLAGGAGTHPFLVGLGWFEQRTFRVRQAFLRGPEEERSMLAACASRLSEARLLVSFFGKSFDRHRLEDKMRQHGIPAPFEGLAHADLYWPCRRLYGTATADTRLGTMERALCSFERQDDLPGAFAPAAWFDFLADRGHLLEEVFRHNLHDVLSLVTLLAHLGRAPAETRRNGSPLAQEGGLGAARARSLAQLHLERREVDAALEWIARARERLPQEQVRSLARLEARALARAGRREEALQRLLSAADGARDDFGAECLVEAASLAKRLGRAPAECAELARRADDLARVTTSGKRRARLAREAGRLLERARSRGR